MVRNREVITIKIKMIALDMDGTLIHSKNSITPRVKDAVLAAESMGIKIVVSTGRIVNSARQGIELLGIETPIISCNGALISKENKHIFKRAIPSEAFEKAAQLLVDYEDIYYRMYGENMYYSKEETESLRNFIDWNSKQKPENQVKVKIMNNPIDIVKEKEDILKIFIVQYKEEKNRYDSLVEKLNQVSGIHSVSSMPKSVDVIHKNVNKAYALDQLARICNIKPENIMAIGDNHNDLDMIRYAGIGVAMGNADEQVKKEADFITKSNLEDGVAIAIEKFVL